MKNKRPLLSLSILFLLSAVPLAQASPAVSGMRQCNGFHSCFANDCLVSYCPVVNGEPQCDMTKIRFPKGRHDPAFIPFKNASRPFVMKAQGRAKGTFLLVHGLSDSPYTFGALAEDLSKRGYNTVAILLTGHGADNRVNHTAATITADAWQQDIEEGLRFSAQAFPRSPLFVGGFSTGGAAVTLFFLRHTNLLPGPNQDPRQPVHGLTLFDPALGLGVLPQLVIQSPEILKRVAPPNESEDPALTVGNNPARIPFDTGSIAGALGQTISGVEGYSKGELKIPTLSLFTAGLSNGSDDGGELTILTWKARAKIMSLVPKEMTESPIDFIRQAHNQLLTREELGACVPRIKREGHRVNDQWSRLVELTAGFADKQIEKRQREQQQQQQHQQQNQQPPRR